MPTFDSQPHQPSPLSQSFNPSTFFDSYPTSNSFIDPNMLMKGATASQYPTLQPLVTGEALQPPYMFTPDSSIPPSPSDVPLSATLSTASTSNQPLSATSTVSLSDVSFSGGPSRTTVSKAARKSSNNLSHSRNISNVDEAAGSTSTVIDDSVPKGASPQKADGNAGSVCHNCSTTVSKISLL